MTVLCMCFLWSLCLNARASDSVAAEPASISGASHSVADAPFKSRCLYAPGHFGNSYEVMGTNEFRDRLAEARDWGFNRYGDWFDTIDCADPFADPHVNLGGVLWERKKTNFLSAQSLGLACDLIVTPNHVYLDQCLPEVAAVKGERVFGQLICPSNPAAREIILSNYDRLFTDLAQAGVRLSALSACPYDYGGCLCDACRPWIVTFARLVRDIHRVAEKSHPGIEMHFIGWWWSKEEHRQFAEWVDREAPGWAKSIALHIPYGETGVPDVVLPQGCERRAFVHIGYAEEASPRDTYGHFGPVIAADRIEATVRELAKQGCTGVMAYSEGVYDDVNKALLAGLSSGNYSSSNAVLSAYAQSYFGADSQNCNAWADWLRRMGKPYTVDPESASKDFNALLENCTDVNWHVRQWQFKTELVRLNAAIMDATEWNAQRLALVDTFWLTQERLQRQVWGLGPLRHALSRRFSPFPWYRGWSDLMKKQHPESERE